MKSTIIAVLIFSFLFVFNSVSAQTISIEWQNNIGGIMYDNLNAIEQTTDHGYIISGISNSDMSGDKTENSNGLFDYWIVKLNERGNIDWQKTIGGNNHETTTCCIQQTSDGGYIMGGSSESNISGDKTENSKGDFDYWVLKLDNSGNIQWQKTIGGSANDFLNAIQQTKDGGYILGGYSTSNISGDKIENTRGFADYWIIKLDSSGTIQWQKTIGGNDVDWLNALQQTIDGGYILGGQSQSGISGDKTEINKGMADYWIVKLDSNGNIQWQKTLGGNGADLLYSLQQTIDGGYILGGPSSSDISGDKTDANIGAYDYWVVKLDTNTNIQWQKTIGGINDDILRSLHQTIDKGYILGGASNSDISGDKTEISKGGYDYWTIQLDTIGNIEWQKTIGGVNDEFMVSSQQTIDEEYILGGDSESNISGDKTENTNGSFDYWIVKLSSKTLPIELHSLSATKKQSSVLLNWQTASEQNNAYFAIERSNNGNNDFKEIGRVNSKGNSNQLQQYSFEDFSPLSGGNYYRLKQADKDGKTTYSKTVFIDFSKAIAIKLYPNPVKDVITLEGLNTNSKTTISIIDLQGHVLAEIATTNSTYTWNIKQLPAGNYYVRIEADKKVTTMKFVKE